MFFKQCRNFNFICLEYALSYNAVNLNRQKNTKSGTKKQLGESEKTGIFGRVDDLEAQTCKRQAVYADSECNCWHTGWFGSGYH